MSNEILTPFRPAWACRILLVVALLTLGACGALSDLIIREEDHDTIIYADVGQTIFVRLPGDGSGGYEWAIAEANPQYLQVIGKPEFELHEPSIEGKAKTFAGVFTFRFETINDGETNLRLIYGPVSGGNGNSTAEFFASITIR